MHETYKSDGSSMARGDRGHMCICVVRELFWGNKTPSYLNVGKYTLAVVVDGGALPGKLTYN